MRRSSDQAGILLSGVQLPQYTPPQEMYPGCHPSLNPALIMRPAMPHTDKDQVPYPAGLHSLSPGDAEAVYNCMDPKLWAESMLNPMMLPPMFDTYYSGLDFHAPGYRKNVTKETTGPLKAWLQDHRKNPYPTKAEKIMLAIITKMTLTQVSTWFANARRRLKKETGRSSPEVDEDGDGRSEDEAEGSDASRSKNGSDHEDESEEISVDDDGDLEDSVPRFQSVRRMPGLDMKSPGKINGHFCSPSRVISGEQTSPRHGSDYICGKQGIKCSKSANATTSCTMTLPESMGHNERRLLQKAPESQTRPVDLSQSASLPGPVCQRQQQQQSCHSASSANRRHDNRTDNASTPKAKIWSISNILSLESKNEDT